MWSEDILQANLTVLDRIYPDLAARVRKSEPSKKYRIQAHPDGGFVCRDEKGRDIHGPAAPLAAVQQLLAGHNLSDPALFIILRPGLGFMAHTLYPKLRKGRHAQRMLIVEDRWDLLRASFALLDWRDLLRSDRVILIAPEEAGSAIVNFFVGNPTGLLEDLSLLPGANLLPEDRFLYQQLAITLSEMRTKVQESTQGFLRDIRQHYAARAEVIRADSRIPRKVLLVQPEHDYLAARLREGFRLIGWEAEQYFINQRLANFLNPWLWLIYVRERFPDVLLWMNRNTLSPVGVQQLAGLPITKVLWYLDNPQRVKVSREELEATDLILTFDRGYIPLLEQLSGKPVRHLPNAPGLRMVRDLEKDGPPPERSGPEVGFVGALAAHRFEDVRGFWLEREPGFVETLDRIVDEFLRYPSPGLQQRYAEAGCLKYLPYEGFVVLYLEERATYLSRRRFLEVVADEGLATFGAKEWCDPEIAGPLAPCFSGRAPDYERELAEVYFNTKININVFHVQCLDSTNPRVYDVLLCGGFLLNEYRPILEEEFEIGKHLDVFRTPEELREKVRYYKAHPEKREEMAREGQKLVRERYTYQHRMQQVAELISRFNR